ncbi:MAG: HAD domain-containing protein [Lachnospiraceae bacterium]
MAGFLFLDVDGVLNGRYTRDRIQGCPGIADRKVRLLSWILQRTGARLVLTSSWKDQWESASRGGRDPFGERLQGAFSSASVRVFGVTKDQGRDRGAGIRDFLKEQGEEVPFVVLDDTVFPDFAVQGILPHLVQTKSRWGLTFWDALRAVRILTREEKRTPG